MDVVRIDRDHGLADWSAALRQRRRAVRELLRLFDEQVRSGIGTAGALALKNAVSGLNQVMGSRYRDEAELIAEASEVALADVIVANLAYDLAQAAGCTAVVVNGERGPLHFRNLDWRFPGTALRRHATALHVKDRFSVIGWPGQFGVLTGMAPGRFSVTVNYVVHARDSGFKAVAWQAVKGFLPVEWAVRDVLEEARSFAQACSMLRRVPLVAPALFTVAGVREDEMAVIERSATEAGVRKPRNGVLCATNHYLSRKLAAAGVDTCEGDSEVRYAAAAARAPRVRSVEEAFALLSDGDLEREDTQYQSAFEPASGRMWARVRGRPIEEVSARRRDG